MGQMSERTQRQSRRKLLRTNLNMDLNFNKVTFDKDLDELSESELREGIQKFQKAQEANAAEFETAAEAVEEFDEDVIEDFEDARETLIEDVTEAEKFDEVPLTEDKLRDEDFGDLQDWKDFVTVEDTDEQPEDDETDDGDFEDMGQKSPTGGKDDTEEFVEEELGEMQGLKL